MASDDKKTETSPAVKNEGSAKKEIATKKKEAEQPKDKNISEVPKAERSDKDTEAPSNYSRGEGQKPVSKAYKENWNAIYAKKK